MNKAVADEKEETSKDVLGDMRQKRLIKMADSNSISSETLLPPQPVTKLTGSEALANVLFAYNLRASICPPADKWIPSSPFSFLNLGETNAKRSSSTRRPHAIATLAKSNQKQPSRCCRYVGLKNLGATCYMNSYLQTLFMNMDFCYRLFCVPRTEHSLMEKGAKEAEESEGSDRRLNVLKELQSLFTDLQLGLTQAADPVGVAKALRIAPDYQEDATEFATLLLMTLERELGGGQSEMNFIPELFRGRQTQSTTCEACGFVSRRTDDFYELRVQIPRTGVPQSNLEESEQRSQDLMKGKRRKLARLEIAVGGGNDEIQMEAENSEVKITRGPMSTEFVPPSNQTNLNEGDCTVSIRDVSELDEAEDVSESFIGKSKVSVSSENATGTFTLEQGLAQLLQSETLHGDNRYMCDRCTKKVDAQRKVSLDSLPPYLHVCFERYAYDGGGRRKLTTSVEYPLLLDMKEFSHNVEPKVEDVKKEISEVTNEVNETSMGQNDASVEISIPSRVLPASGDDDTYELVGVLEHHGLSALSGHYVAYLKDLSRELNRAKDLHASKTKLQNSAAPRELKLHRKQKSDLVDTKAMGTRMKANKKRILETTPSVVCLKKDKSNIISDALAKETTATRISAAVTEIAELPTVISEKKSDLRKDSINKALSRRKRHRVEANQYLDCNITHRVAQSEANESSRYVETADVLQEGNEPDFKELADAVCDQSLKKRTRYHSSHPKIVEAPGAHRTISHKARGHISTSSNGFSSGPAIFLDMSPKEALFPSPPDLFMGEEFTRDAHRDSIPLCIWGHGISPPYSMYPTSLFSTSPYPPSLMPRMGLNPSNPLAAVSASDFSKVAAPVPPFTQLNHSDFGNGLISRKPTVSSDDPLNRSLWPHPQYMYPIGFPVPPILPIPIHSSLPPPASTCNQILPLLQPDTSRPKINKDEPFRKKRKPKAPNILMEVENKNTASLSSCPQPVGFDTMDVSPVSIEYLTVETKGASVRQADTDQCSVRRKAPKFVANGDGVRWTSSIDSLRGGLTEINSLAMNGCHRGTKRSRHAKSDYMHSSSSRDVSEDSSRIQGVSDQPATANDACVDSKASSNTNTDAITVHSLPRRRGPKKPRDGGDSEIEPTANQTLPESNRQWNWVAFDDASVAEWKLPLTSAGISRDKLDMDNSSDKVVNGIPKDCTRLSSKSAYLLLYKRKAWLPSNKPCPPKDVEELVLAIDQKVPKDVSNGPSVSNDHLPCSNGQDEFLETMKNLIQSRQKVAANLKQRLYSVADERSLVNVCLKSMVFIPTSWWVSLVCHSDATQATHYRPTNSSQLSPSNSVAADALKVGMQSLMDDANMVDYSDVLCHHYNCTIQQNIAPTGNWSAQDLPNDTETNDGNVNLCDPEKLDTTKTADLQKGMKISSSMKLSNEEPHAQEDFHGSAFGVDPIAVWEGKLKLMPKSVAVRIFNAYNLRASIPFIEFEKVLCQRCSDAFSQLVELFFEQWSTLADMMRFCRNFEPPEATNAPLSESNSMTYSDEGIKMETLTWVSKRELLELEGNFSARDRSKRKLESLYDVFSAAKDVWKEVAKLRRLSSQGKSSIHQNVPQGNFVDLTESIICPHGNLLPMRKAATRVLVPKSKLLRFIELEDLKAPYLVNEFGVALTAVQSCKTRAAQLVDVLHWRIDATKSKIRLLDDALEDALQCLQCESDALQERAKAFEWRKKVEEEKRAIGDCIYKKVCKLVRVNDNKRFTPYRLAEGRHFLVPTRWIDEYLRYLSGKGPDSCQKPSEIDASMLFALDCTHRVTPCLSVDPIFYLEHPQSNPLHPRDNAKMLDWELYIIVHDTDFSALKKIYGAKDIPFFNVRWISSAEMDANKELTKLAGMPQNINSAHCVNYDYSGSVEPCFACVQKRRFSKDGVGDFKAVPLRIKVETSNLSFPRQINRRQSLMVDGDMLVSDLVKQLGVIVGLSTTELMSDEMKLVLEGPMTSPFFHTDSVVEHVETSQMTMSRNPHSVWCRLHLSHSILEKPLRHLETKLEDGWCIRVIQSAC